MWIGLATAWALEPCDHGASCFALAEAAVDPAEAQAYLERGCETGDRGLCARAALGRVERGGSVDAERVTLRELCEGAVEDACAADELLGLGSPARSFAAQRARPALEPEVVWRRCYWARVQRGGDPWGDLRAVVQYGPDGTFEGAVTTGRYVDDELRACVSEQAALVRPAPTARGVRSRYIWPFDHGAVVSLDGERYAELPVRPLEACFDGLEVEYVSLVVRASADGTLGRVRWVDPSGSDAADDCVLALLTERAASLDEGRARVEIWPHQWARPSSRPQPPAEDARELPDATPVVVHLSPSSLPMPTGLTGTCTAAVTVEPDGYASRVDLGDCPAELSDGIVAPLMSWQWSVSEAVVTTLRFELRGDASRILAGGRTLAFTRAGPPPVPSD